MESTPRKDRSDPYDNDPTIVDIDFLVYIFTYFLLKVKVRLKRFHMNGHTIGLHRETQKFRL